ncbi:EthD domain-containing protein [Zavarzinia compransoris]|uniref:EthD domain-containing protein n=1 Tax=Zavarzinia marina TaxID=2911065 RepID=UPI001F27274F|nr:EthD domain-containing protein [Zavarzinia marina]MCF4166544.1 EthD domain-containing protein [Zavarzinia marina]
MIKLMVCMRRQPGMSRERFQHYWREVHGPMAVERAKALGISRYIQNVTVHEEISAALAATRGTPVAYDGIDSLYWDSIEDMLNHLGSPEGGRAASELFLDHINFIDYQNSPIFIGEEVDLVGGSASAPAVKAGAG